MSFFPIATDAPTPKSKNVRSIALLYAAILVVFLVSQLFTYDDFVALIDSFWLPGGTQFAAFLSAFIVCVELFALPFLLGMRVSPALRVVSMGCGWIAAGIWISLSIWLQVTVNEVANIGFLGEIVTLTPGWWAILLSIGLGLLSAWSTWGLWPLGRKK